MKVSIVTTSFNSARTIADTLHSVRSQDWNEFEHIIVDGASRDATMSIVQQHAHDRLMAVSEPDAGRYDAMNKGLARATGDVVGFLNSDDFFARSDAIRRIVEAFQNSGADCVGGQTVVVDEQDVRRVRRLYRSVGFQRSMLRFGHMPPHPAFYARRDLLLRVGGFDPAYEISGDFDLMVKLFYGVQASFAAIPETIAVFREGGASTKNLQAKLTINSEIARSLRGRGVISGMPLLWARYPFKALQLMRRPSDYP